MRIEREDHHGRDHEAEERVAAEEPGHDDGEALLPHQSQSERQDRAERKAERRGPHHAGGAEPSSEPRRELRGTEEPGGVEREGERELGRRQTVALGIDEGRGGDEDEEARHREAAEEGQRQEPAVGHQAAHASPCRAGIEGLAQCGGQRLGQREPGEREARHGGEREHDEDRAPREGRDQPGPRQGREERRDRDHDHDRRHHLRRAVPGMQIADHRAWHHHHRRPAEPLHEAPRDQPADRGRRRADERAREEDEHAYHDRALPPCLIGPGPVDQLGEAEGHEIARDGGLHRDRPGPERVPDGGHRGQVHVDGEGSDGRQEPQDERQRDERQLHDASLGSPPR